MKLIDFLSAHFREDDVQWCFYAEDLERELNAGDDLLLEVTNVDRDGFQESIREHVESVDRFYYWLDSSEDSDSYIDELFRIGQILVISSLTVGPYCDEEADAYGTLRLIICPDPKVCEDTLDQLRKDARDNAIRLLSEPLVRHRKLLGDTQDTAQAILDILLNMTDKEPLQERFAFYHTLLEDLAKTRQQTAQRCFETVLQGRALQFQAVEGRLEITESDGTRHDLDEVITSVDHYLAMSQTLGAPATSVDTTTLRIASQVLLAAP